MTEISTGNAGHKHTHCFKLAYSFLLFDSPMLCGLSQPLTLSPFLLLSLQSKQHQASVLTTRLNLVSTLRSNSLAFDWKCNQKCNFCTQTK